MSESNVPKEEVICDRCMCEIKTLVAAPHSEWECILALKAEVARLTEIIAELSHEEPDDMGLPFPGEMAGMGRL